MTGRVIRDPLVEIRTETQHGAFLEFLIDEPGGHQQGIADHLVFYAEEAGIFVPEGEGAGRGRCHDLQAFRGRGADDRHVVAGVARGLLRHAVGDHRDAAALFLVEQLHADAEGIEDLHQILAQLRIIVVDVAAVIVGDLLGEGGLGRGLALQPGLEAAAAVFRERAVLVDLHRAVEHGLRHAHLGDAVDHRRERPGQGAHEIGGGQDAVAKLRLRVVVADAGRLDQVGDLHARRAGDLAALAVQTVFQGVVEEERVFQAETLPVGPGLLGAGVERVDLQHGAIGRADRALHALFEIVLAFGVFLQFHSASFLRI